MPERFIVKGGRVRSTHETFDEGDCLIYVQRDRAGIEQWGFLIPTGKNETDGSPVFDDFITFKSREDAGSWMNRLTPAPTQPVRPAAPRG
jgi:hypothetical protein